MEAKENNISGTLNIIPKQKYPSIQFSNSENNYGSCLWLKVHYTCFNIPKTIWNIFIINSDNNVKASSKIQGQVSESSLASFLMKTFDFSYIYFWKKSVSLLPCQEKLSCLKQTLVNRLSTLPLVYTFGFLKGSNNLAKMIKHLLWDLFMQANLWQLWHGSEDTRTWEGNYSWLMGSVISD